jgi:ABC-type polysaccharide/polyol phosphate transport system ATPase subunit
MPHVRFEDVSKIYSRQSREFVYRFFLEAFGGKKKEPFYALSDVSFEAGAGDALAIVGHNGAGKSTLLNLVAGLTVPEKGRVQVGGRVGALLELGSGFHPDLTGEENLRMNASLLGLSKRETSALHGKILEFSELGEFITEPLRTFSQGMILRLAFSIAVHVDPDILLIDEVLAVGDTDFQKKCLERIKGMKDSGKILLCVSHAPEILRQLCTRALWIEHGRTIRQGPVGEVLDAYISQAGTMQAASAR